MLNSANLRRIVILISALLVAGCATKIPDPGALEYREIPPGYLQDCELPSAPLANANLSDAFVQAYQCAEQGNRDKARIRELTER